MSAEDLSKIGQMCLNKGIYSNKQIVSSKWIQQMTTPYIKCDEKFAFMQYGYLWWIIKEDEAIKIFAEKIVSKGYQLLSFDLPEHEERKDDTNYLCKVENCVKDLKSITEYAKEKYDEISLWACSMGAYFSLLVYKDEDIKQCLFLSTVANML